MRAPSRVSAFHHAVEPVSLLNMFCRSPGAIVNGLTTLHFAAVFIM